MADANLRSITDEIQLGHVLLGADLSEDDFAVAASRSTAAGLFLRLLQAFPLLDSATQTLIRDRIGASPVIQPGLSFGTATSVDVTFSSGTYVVTSLAVPSTAQVIELVLGHARLRNTHYQNAALWRTLPIVAAGDSGSDSNRITLADFGFVGKLGLGRAANQAVALHYDGGFTSLPAGNVQLRTA